MYVVAIPNRRSRPAILLRESYREGRRVRNRTLANLTDWAPARVEALRAVLRGATPTVATLEEAFEIERSRPHGHVAAVLGTMRRIELPALLERQRGRRRDVNLAMIAARIVEPCSKLATAGALRGETLHSTLGEVLGVEDTDEDELYEAMDWLLSRQARIEQTLARRHLQDGGLVLYDVTSSYFEGRCCPLARLGHSRDGKRNKLQIVFGLLTNGEGCPVAVEVFEGNVGDPNTLASQIQKVRQRFGIQRLVLVGDRGMITEARIRDNLKGVAGLDWLTALRAPAIAKLAEQGTLQPSLFDDRDLAEITSSAYPGERLVVCRNPLLAEERARKRRELLEATERDLHALVQATQRPKRALRGAARIGLRVGKVLGRYKMGKHFRIEIAERSLRVERDEESIAREAALDGLYVLRTTVGTERLSTDDVVRSYKRLAELERAFRSLKTVDLKVRPIHHRKADRVRAHVFLCMLAYYVEWHMRRALAPLLFDDDDPQAAQALRRSVLAPAQRSPRAKDKALTKRTEDGLAVHSFQGLLRDLATVTKNRVRPRAAGLAAFDVVTTPTPLQRRAFELLGFSYRM